MTVQPADVHAVLARHMLVDGYPLVVDLERSHGCFIHDARTGREYIDFFSFFASNPLGMNHPRMLDAETQERIARTATVKVSNADKYTTYMAEFVEMLARTAAPPTLPHYFFIEGGALAVENALKTAFDWKSRKNIAAGRTDQGRAVLHLEGAFHGRSGYTLSLTNTDPNKTAYFPKFDWPRISAPRIRFPLEGGNLTDVVVRERAAVASAEAALQRDPHGIAAIILEPIQGEGGDGHFRPSFFAALRRLADEYDALLVYDEVQTGLGLTGRWWAYQHHGIEPDILCFAKKMQVGGIFVSKRIDDVRDNVFARSGRINSTWGGALVDMVRCTRILELIVEERLLDNARDRGRELLSELTTVEARLVGVDNARGAGLMCAVDLPDRNTRDAVIRACFDEGMIVIGCGERSLRFRPPLTIDAEIVAEGARRLTRALERTL